METSEWWHASVDIPVPGDEIGPNGNNPGAGGGRNLHLRTSCIIRVSRSSDPLVTAYRNSVAHLSLISVLDGTALNWCQQEVLRAQMSNTVLFGKVKDPELMVYNFRGQLQCTMGGKREGPIETYHSSGT